MGEILKFELGKARAGRVPVEIDGVRYGVLADPVANALAVRRVLGASKTVQSAMADQRIDLDGAIERFDAEARAFVRGTFGEGADVELLGGGPADVLTVTELIRIAGEVAKTDAYKAASRLGA